MADGVEQTAQIDAVVDDIVAKQVRRFRKMARGVTPRHCPICDYRGMFVAFGQPPRYDARCPSCRSLERHRLLALLLTGEHAPFAEGARVLHFAPEPPVTRVMQSLSLTYETADILPRRRPTHILNIEDIDLPDAGFDGIICSHVLEHVDDAKALAEMFRILKPGGTALLMTPVCEGWATTYENPAIDGNIDRALHFGQADHVRYYGRDLRDRIRAAGFDLAEFTAQEPEVHTHGLIRGETVFLARRPEGPV
ncbi:MAG: methyltransferase domain-containing protein [Pseudomonadota bacterium]